MKNMPGMLSSEFHLLAAAGVAADGSTSDLLDTVVLALIGCGIVLVLLGIVFHLRQLLGALVNLCLVVAGALLLLAAIFGGPLGIYDRTLAPPAEAAAPPSDEQGQQATDGRGQQDGIEDIEKATEAW